MHDLVESALQERRVDRHDRDDPLRREPRREGHRMLLADSDVEEALRKLLEERKQTGATGHRRRDRDGALIRGEDLPDRVCEHRRVLRRVRLRRSGGRHAVPLHVVLFGRTVAVALLTVDVYEDRAVAEIPGALEKALECEEIVAVDGSEIGEAELLEEQVWDEERLEAVEDAAARLLREVATGHVLQDLTRHVLRRPIRLGGAKRFEHPRDRPDVGGDAHAVVVEDDDHAGAHVTDVVKALERHAGRERAVADDRDDVVILALEITRDGHALRGGDRGPGVSRAELIVFRLGAHQESRDAAVLPERAEVLPPSGEHLVHVRLVAGIPDELVPRRIEYAMQRYRELDRPEARGDVAAGLLHVLDGEVTDLLTELEQLVGV